MQTEKTVVKVKKYLVVEAHKYGFNASGICNKALEEAVSTYRKGQELEQ